MKCAEVSFTDVAGNINRMKKLLKFEETLPIPEEMPFKIDLVQC